MSNAECDETADRSEESEKRNPNRRSRCLFLACPPNACNGNEARRDCCFEHTEEETDCSEAGERGAGCCKHEDRGPDDDVNYSLSVKELQTESADYALPRNLAIGKRCIRATPGYSASM